MVVHTQLCFLLLGTCLVSLLLLLECRKLEGYAFPVFSTKECPGNQAEWKNRSSAINCTDSNGYMCLPNENFTELLEFCYIYPRILVQKDLCLYLVKRFSRIDSYNCRIFTNGCPKLSYFSSETYTHPSCMEIENGCFSAEPSCKRQPLQSKTSDDNTLPIMLGVSIPICLLCILGLTVIGIKVGICKKRRETVREDEETQLLLCGYEECEPTDKNKEHFIEEVILDQWKHDDKNFISTKACEEVERNIKSRNMVIVYGHSGSGKSAIIQHIALKYREQGWTVRRVKGVEDIVNIFYSGRFQKDKTICVFNDPLGKEFFDEIYNDSWQRYEDDLKLFLKTAKILMSCRNYIISDSRMARYLVNQSAILDIDNEKYKLSVEEKRHILTKYTLNMNLSDEDCNEIVKVERYFPLLCSLCSSKEKYISKGIRFFTEPVTVLKEEIIEFKEKDRGKYCALALLVLFNDDLCVSDLLKNKDNENKFKQMLKLCGLPESTPSTAIGNNLDSVRDCFVKMIGDRFHFYHDLVMEVTTHVFGTDYPTETIRYADIGFLRKKVRLGNCERYMEPFTIYLSDKYIEELGERLFTELFGNRLIDVALNPCLKNEKVIETLKKIIQKHPEKLPMILEKKKLKYEKQNYYTKYLTKIAFMSLENDLSPLYVLIVYSHTDLSRECLNTLTRMHIKFKISSLLPAVYCNGSMQLFHLFPSFHVKESLTNVLRGFSPIHIVSAFHNYDILEELIMIGGDVNSISNTWDQFTPLLLAVSNDTQEYEYYFYERRGAHRREITVQLLLDNGADINLCDKDGASPLYIACQNGYDRTVQLLLSNGADINLCANDGGSPLYIACQNGYDSTVQLLLSNGADINLCANDRGSLLYIACQNGYDRTVRLLLSNGADINLCANDGASPLYISCQNGHDSTVQLLLSNGANIKLCAKKRTSSLYIACQNGHDSTVQLLLSNGADITLCDEDGASPLYIACQNGHDSTVQLLLSNGADINLCDKDGASPLYISCQKGHDSTVKCLLSNGADINLCNKNGASPLYTACRNLNFGTVELLLRNGADINLCDKDGTSPLYKACQKGYRGTVKRLLSNGADINLCNKNGASPLYTACRNLNFFAVEQLLSNGADINLCDKDGASPLYIACQNGQLTIAQILLSNGADINLCIKDGVSPLYIAFKERQYKTVNILLNNGTDTSLACGWKDNPDLVNFFDKQDSTIVFLLQKDNISNNLYNPDSFFSLFVSCQIERVTRMIYD